jgi:hypothetical protein
MAIDYTPKHFLRLAEKALLQEYFARHNMLVEFDWDSIPDGQIDAIYFALREASDFKQEEIERDFRLIFDLASANGARTLIEEARYQELDLVSALEQRDGYLNRAFWVFLNQRNLFDTVSVFDRVDHLHGRYWRKRKDLPKKRPDLGDGTISELGNAISAYYQKKEGRGKFCRVEHCLRGQRYHCFFAYPKDYPDTFIGYDDAGSFERKRQAPAFDVIFVFDPLDGTLDLYAPGDRRQKQDLQRIFARCILREEIGDEDPRSIPYELNSLKNPSFAFPTDPSDGIAEVRIRELRLSLLGNERKRITLQVGPRGSPSDIHDLVTHALHEHRLPLSMVDVTSVVIQMRFNGDGIHRSRVLSFRITAPDTCSLKDKPDHLVAKRYLKQWSLEHA